MGVAGFALLILLISQITCHSQETDTISAQQSDTLIAQETSADTLTEEHSPAKAALLAAALPGLGQIYNNKIWKVPLVYIGAGIIYYAYDFNSRHYDEYKTAYSRFINGQIDEYNGITTEEGLKRAKDYYRRYRDLNILLFAGMYLLQIIDATVDAYLFNFDVSEDITMNLSPKAVHSKTNYAIPGIKFSINF
jgi:hypothetical protein